MDTIDTDNYKLLKGCDTKNKSDDIKIKKKACVKGKTYLLGNKYCNFISGFIKCKSAQDDSVEGVGSCKKVNKCGGAPNKTEAARLLKILTP